MTPTPLGRLRLRLTIWYLFTFGIILVLLGAGLFVVVRNQFSDQLDASLVDATQQLIRAARIREIETRSASGPVMDAVDELHIPDRTLYLLDSAGTPLKPAGAETWIRAAALLAVTRSSVDQDRHASGDRALRVHAESFRLANGTTLVAAAVADKIELEDQYASLIASFGFAAAGALLLVSVGGWFLVRKSTAPVERNIENMRRFMADAAHELRTPVTVLRSRAEVALQQPRDSGSYIEALRGIEAESLRMGGIVDDLLTLARADAGDRPLVRERVYLDDLVMDAASAARSLGEPRGVKVDVGDYEEAVVSGDPALLRQLAMILLDNAVKFSSRGGEVKVSVFTREGRPTLVVEDDGPGISTEHMAHIFERFYRGDPARSRSNAEDDVKLGSGLGLSIARWIADMHGAQIEMGNRAPTGLSATIIFPQLEMSAS